MKKVDWKHKGDACPCPSCKIRRGEETAPPITQRSYGPPPVKVSIRTDGKVFSLEPADSEKKRVSEDDRVEMPLVSEKNKAGVCWMPLYDWDVTSDERKEHLLQVDIFGCRTRLAFLEEQLEALRRRRGK